MPDHIHLSVEHTAEVQRCQHSRISEGEECGTYPQRFAEESSNDRIAFLGRWILRQHNRL